MLNRDKIFAILIFFLISIFSLKEGYTQYSVLNQEETEKFSMEFTKEYLEVAAGKSFFNVLKLVNKSSRMSTVNLQFNLPPGWTFFGEQSRSLTLAPFDSIMIPVRGSASQQVLGEIGYSIIAALSDKRGKPLLNAYTFIKIPKEKLLKYSSITRSTFFNQESKTAIIRFKLNNEGNVDELVTLLFKSSDNITLPGEVNNFLTTELLVPPKADTIVEMPVKLEKSITGRTMYSVDLQVMAEDIKFASTFWVEDLINTYTYQIPDNEKPLIIEFGAHNLFQDSDPYFSTGISGQLLFKKNKELYYYYRNHHLSKFNQNFLNYSRGYAGYNSNKISIRLGDYLGFPLYNQNARGGILTYNLFRSFHFGGMYSRSIIQPSYNYGVTFKNMNPKFNFDSYFNYTDNQFNRLKANVGIISTRYKIAQKHAIETSVGLSTTDHLSDNTTKTGYHYKFNYKASSRNMFWYFQNYYGSRFFYGKFYGRSNINSQVFYRINKTDNISLTFVTNKNNPPNYILDSIPPEQYTLSRLVRLNYSKLNESDLRIFIEPIFENQESNSYINYNRDNPFTSISTKALFGISVGSGDKVFSPYITTGYTWITNYDDKYNGMPISILQQNSDFFNALFTLRVRRKEFGAFLNYYYGPFTVNQQFNYFYSTQYYQSIRLMPFYDDFIYKDILKLTVRASYLNEILRKTQRVNTNSELTGYLSNGYTVSFLNTINYQKSIQADDTPYKYTSSYFEFKIKKEFDWNQPRYQYHNLVIIFYKDLNGNLKKDENEPGINDILVELNRIDETQFEEYNSGFDYQGQFNTTSLLSNSYGEISYQNIIKGFYQVDFRNVGISKGNFSSKETNFILEIDKDKTIYIPFLEHNKIFGKIVLNRSKLSNLGKIDVSNIKVKAVDSYGNETSTLTDKNGNFVIYAPSVDRYIVSVNNIFYEHFDLQQNNFLVQLNGYKQFEVNFIFSEKRRQINFAPSLSSEELTIKTIKRTNLTGTIRDENTLSPVIAKIEIVDNNTGEIISDVHSDRTTGAYSISFITGQNYSIAVYKEGYWYHTEKLYLDQLTTIQDIRKDIFLKNIIINSKFELKNLTFESGSAEIPQEAYPELERLAMQLKNNPNIQVQIAGHVDALEVMQNDKLSEERAKVVTKYFIEQGYSNISYVGYKAFSPVASNDTEAGRSKNRRVEITITDK